MQPYQNPTGYGAGYAQTQAEVDQGLRSFMLGVYNNMILGLAVSALVALAWGAKELPLRPEIIPACCIALTASAA